MMIPAWLQVIAAVSLILAGVSALFILGDILAGHPQKMPIMTIVWPVTALYFGPVAVWAYWTMGRSHTWQRRKEDPGRELSSEKEQGQAKETRKPFWKTTFVGVTHCGSGCTIGDIIGEWIVFWLGLTLAGIALWPEYVLDFFLAYLLGIVFQYFAIAPMCGLSGWKGL